MNKIASLTDDSVALQTTIKDAWSHLNEQEKLKLLPHLLSSTQEWNAWRYSGVGLISWFKRKFEKAGVQF